MNNEMTGIALAVGLLSGGIAFAVLPDAWAIDDANNQAIVDSHKVEISDGKAYTVVDGLVSNEWQPTTEQGYTDEYRASDEYKMVKAANESLKRIRSN